MLPHFLDKEGRNSVAPSLYDRDAYQVYLRDHPNDVSALRFDIEWKYRKPPTNSFQMKLEVRGTKLELTQTRKFQNQVVPRRMFSTWSAITIPAKDYAVIGKVVAWRVSLWSGETQMGEQKSFLW